MGALDLLGGGTPYDPKPVNLDADTSGLIDSSAKDAMRSKDDIAKASMQGTGDTNFAAGAKGPGNVAISGALQNKFQKLAGDNMAQLGLQQSYNANQRSADMLKQSANEAYARQQISMQNYQRMVNAYNNQVAARAQVISSLLGLGGMAAGMAVGGPMGGMAGGAVGSRMGPKPKTIEGTQSDATGANHENYA